MTTFVLYHIMQFEQKAEACSHGDNEPKNGVQSGCVVSFSLSTRIVDHHPVEEFNDVNYYCDI